MKKLCIGLILSVVLMSATRHSAFAASAEEAFARLLSLSGTWEGAWKSDKGESYPMRLTYVPISEKAAVMETMDSLADGTSMVTIYHTDGDKLMATHYCRFKNQPRMTAEVPEGSLNKLDFHFLDGRNLSASHVTDISFEFVDENTLIQGTRFKNSDMVATVRYTRVPK